MTDLLKLAAAYARGALRGAIQQEALKKRHQFFTPFFKYIVIDVISDPYLINTGQDPQKVQYWRDVLRISNMDYVAGSSNAISNQLPLPRNTVIAQRVRSGKTSQENLPMFLLPFFPSHLALPCKPGEHVWVMFDHPKNKQIGYWMCKVAELSHVDDVNHCHPPRAYEPSFFPGTKELSDGGGTHEPEYVFANGVRVKLQDGSTQTLAETAPGTPEDELFYEKIVQQSAASQLIPHEAVPRFKKRPGDVAIEGSNNTLIVLGTDRTGPYSAPENQDSIQGSVPFINSNDVKNNAGTIDIVAGRGQTPSTFGKVITPKTLDGSSFEDRQEIGKGHTEIIKTEGDPDWKNDRSRVLVSQKTRTDINLGISDKNYYTSSTTPPKKSSLDAEEESGAIVIKSDKVRIVARMDVEILVPGFEKDENGNAKSLEDTNGYAAVVIKSNGDIVFRPSATGFIKLGGDDANLAILCNTANPPEKPGVVTSKPIIDDMGGKQGQGGVAGQFATKVLIK